MSLVASGGGVVLGGDVSRYFRAFDDETDVVLWVVNLGPAVTGSRGTHAVNGRHCVAVDTGAAGTVRDACHGWF